MISFIVIGKNEGWRLSKCIQSIFDTIDSHNLSNAEVIYVDSQSTDDSIERVKEFDGVNIFEITGECNAAVARNIGAKEANRDILFFIDGDMEIDKDFLNHAILNGELKYDYVTGHLDDYLYGYDDQFLGVDQRTYQENLPKEKQFLDTNGGIFLIKKKLWEKLGGMKTKYNRSQDLDLSVRLAKENIALVRLPVMLAKHHTIDYKNDQRMWKNLQQGYFLYISLLYRDHIFTPIIWKRFFRSDYTALLLFGLILSLATQQFTSVVMTVFLSVYFIRSLKHTYDTKIAKNKIIYFFERMGYQVACDVGLWFAIFLFFPKSSKIRYKNVVLSYEKLG